MHFTAEQRPAWEAWVIVLIPLLICFLGGGRSVFAKGVAASLIGVLMIMRPPTYQLPRYVGIAFVEVILAPLASFLPVGWLNPAPDWRLSLVENWGIQLGDTSTPQPWVTFEAWLLASFGASWLAWCVARGTTNADRVRILKVMVLGCFVLTILTLLHRQRMITIPWWIFPAELGNTYGPFANRNHTSSLIALASVLAVALVYDCYRKKKRAWLGYAMCVVPFFILIISNTSRTGVILFFLGIMVWMGTSAMRRGFFKKTALISTLAFTGISLVIVFGGKLADRFKTDATGTVGIMEFQTRVKMYVDAMSMTTDSPWTGVGLGNFKNTYPNCAEIEDPWTIFLHPESDFFWTLAEGGMLTLMAWVACIMLIILITGPWRSSESKDADSRQDRRLRTAAGTAALLSVLHCFVDVPIHSLGYGLVAALLLASAINPSRIRAPALWYNKLIFRLGGLAICTIGILWLITASGRPVLPGISSSLSLSHRARALSADGRDADAIALIDKAIQLNPLNWAHYFLRAQIHLRLKHPTQEALLDFGRARALNPHFAGMCENEANIWLEYNPPLAIQAWKDLLARSVERDYYGYALNQMVHHPSLRPEIRRLADSPVRKLKYLEWASDKEDFMSMLNELLRQQQALNGLEPEQRLRLFRTWQSIGDREKLTAMLEARADWQQAGWPVLAEERARSGDFKGACDLVFKYVPPQITPSVTGTLDIAQLENNFRLNPLDPRIGIDLYFAQRAKALFDEALATLERVSQVPGAPSYISYEMAAMHAQKQDHRRAWDLLVKHLAASK